MSFLAYNHTTETYAALEEAENGSSSLFWVEHEHDASEWQDGWEAVWELQKHGTVKAVQGGHYVFTVSGCPQQIEIRTNSQNHGQNSG